MIVADTPALMLELERHRHFAPLIAEKLSPTTIRIGALTKSPYQYVLQGANTEQLYQWAEGNAAWDLSIVRRPEGSEGWVHPPCGRGPPRCSG